MKATNIKWDVDDIEDLEDLPTEMDIPCGMEDEDEISDWLSEQTGFCHYGFELEEDDDDVHECGVQDWERDDAMHDYLNWLNELDRLMKQEIHDEKSINETKVIIADYEDALFG